MKRRRFLTIAAAFALPRPGRAESLRWRADALGGTVQVELRGPQKLTEETVQAIADVIEEVETAASLFRPASALNRLNAEGHLGDPPPALRDLLALSGRLFTLTAGRFDPTVQPLWKALAAGGDVAAAQALVGWERITAGDEIRLAPGQMLTLNGLAQGYAADRVREVLRQSGYGPALVDMGEFAAFGGPFNLGVEDPELGPVQTVRLTDMAAATSSPAAMRLGEAFHILGPHGEKPLWSTISVVMRQAALADGLSTAFCLMDGQAIRDTLKGLGEKASVTAVTLGGDVVTFQG